ncbi:hypothetical protein V8G54_004430 [Vigna mungo]|uniref:Uncharacterized protein n=1 Tax=Vigna mungo TaxID=3915 RepID=A0AAQ3PBR5_VIGMU
MKKINNSKKNTLIFLAFSTTVFHVSLFPSISSGKNANEEKTRGINPVDLPIRLWRLLQDHPVKHRHVVMQPNGEAHQDLGQAQELGAQATVGGEDEDEIHEEEQQIEHVSESLQHLQAQIRGLRSRV